MKLFHVNLNVNGLEPWLADEFRMILTKLPEYGETISTESLVVSRTQTDAMSQMQDKVMRAIAKHYLMDPATLKELAGSLKGIMVVEPISMREPRVLFLHCSVSPMANAA